MIPTVGQWSGVAVYPVMGWWMWTISRYHDQQSSAEDKIHPNFKEQIPLALAPRCSEYARQYAAG